MTTVAPLTTAVLAAVPTGHAGLASAVNNAVARAAGLIMVAALPAAAGLAGRRLPAPGRLLGRLPDGHGAGRGAVRTRAAWSPRSPSPARLVARRLKPERRVAAEVAPVFSCPLDAPPLCDDEPGTGTGTGTGTGSGGEAPWASDRPAA